MREAQCARQHDEKHIMHNEGAAPVASVTENPSKPRQGFSGMAHQGLWRVVFFVYIVLTVSVAWPSIYHRLSHGFLMNDVSCLHSGRVSLSPIDWESVMSGTHNCTFERVPRLRVASAAAELQTKLDQAVESKDYELAASLKRKLESAEPSAPVAKEVWRETYLLHLPSVVTWLSSLPRKFQLAAGRCPNDAGQITGEDCRTLAMGAWSRIVAGEEEARAYQLTAAESLVKQILTRAAHLGHRKVVISPLDVDLRPSVSSDRHTCVATWTVHAEMAAAAFLATALEHGEDDSSSPRSVAAARTANVAAFVEQAFEKGKPVSCAARKDKLRYSTLIHSQVSGGLLGKRRPEMDSTDFVEHAAATFHECEATSHEATSRDCSERLHVRFGAHPGWVLGRNAGLKNTLEALAREWRDAGECLQSAYELSRNTGRTNVGASASKLEYINLDTRFAHLYGDKDDDDDDVPDFLAMYPSLPWATDMSFFDAAVAEVDERLLEGDGTFSAQEHRTASEQIVLAGRFLRQHLDFESTLSAGGPEDLATLLLSDPIGSLMLCWRLQRAGFWCQIEDAANQGPPDSHRGSVLTVDLFAPMSPVQDLACVLAENMDEMGWG